MAAKKKPPTGAKKNKPPPATADSAAKRLAHFSNEQLFTIVSDIVGAKTLGIPYVRAAARELCSRSDARTFLTLHLADPKTQKLAEQLLKQLPPDGEKPIPVVIVETAKAEEGMDNITLLRLIAEKTNGSDERRKAWEILHKRSDLKEFLKGPFAEQSLVKTAQAILEKIRNDQLEEALAVQAMRSRERVSELKLAVLDKDFPELFTMFGEAERSDEEQLIIVGQIMRRKGAATALLRELRDETTRDRTKELLRFIIERFKMVPGPILREWAHTTDEALEKALDEVLLSETLKPIVEKAVGEFYKQGGQRPG